MNIFAAAVMICLAAAFVLAAPTLREFLTSRISESPLKNEQYKNLAFEEICPIDTDPVARRVFSEYGAIYSAEPGVHIPWKCIFENSEEVGWFHKRLKIKSAVLDNTPIELQENAMNSILKASGEASLRGLRIIPLDGPIAGRRNYYDTLRLWHSRFSPGLEYWVSAGRIAADDAVATRLLNTRKQIEKVIDWEAQGMFFSTDRSRTVFSSTAPPGTSQHISLLALDVENYGDAEIREILALSGWYQTVLNDPTHFTYIGLPEADLPNRGLTIVIRGPYRYWVPRM